MQMKTKTTESASSARLPAIEAEERLYAGSFHLNVLRTVFLTVALALMVLGCDDKPPKVHKVGIICGADFFLPVIDGFKTKMTELGFIEGQNIQYAVRAFNTNPQEERLAAETFVNEKVDLIVTTPTQPSLQAHAAIEGTTIPLLFSYAGLEGTRLVNKVSEPGGNTTGLRFPGPEQIGKRLELMLAFMPDAKRVWIGYDGNYPNILPCLDVLRPLALSRGVTLIEVAAGAIAEIEADLGRRALTKDPGIDAIILMPDTFNHSPAGWEAIRRFAAARGIPIGGSFLYTVQQGALFGNANDLFQVGALTAPLAIKILHGMPAGSIPVVTPEQLLIVNYRVARDLGIKVPEGLLNMATQIIR